MCKQPPSLRRYGQRQQPVTPGQEAQWSRSKSGSPSFRSPACPGGTTNRSQWPKRRGPRWSIKTPDHRCTRASTQQSIEAPAHSNPRALQVETSLVPSPLQPVSRCDAGPLIIFFPLLWPYMYLAFSLPSVMHCPPGAPVVRADCNPFHHTHSL